MMVTEGVKEIDQRNVRILQEIVVNPHLRMIDLEHRLHLSRRQVQYSLTKINDWLQEQELPTLQYHRGTGFEVTPEITEAFFRMHKEITPERYPLKEEERVQLLLLMLLSKTEDLSLFHLTSRLDVSRNTVLQDLKKAKELASRFWCSIQYSRREGYSLNGDEWQIRLLLTYLTHELGSDDQGKSLLMLPLAPQDQEKVPEIQKSIEAIEQTLQIRYIDERLTALPYFILYVWIRIQTGHALVKIDESLQSVILSSEEYQALMDLFQYLRITTEDMLNERIYLTLQLLTTNLAKGDQLLNPQDQQLFHLTQQVIEQFEAIACVRFHNRLDLARQLFQHLKPAYYRVKFGMKENNTFYQTVIQEQPELHHLVKKALHPFHSWLGQPFPENESAYVTMYFGSWLKRQGEELSNRLKAVIVCPKGIAISKLLVHRLKEMFPDLIFLDTLSLRDFYAYPFSHQIVFSTVFVRTKARLFIVKPIIDQVEKKRLHQEVMQELYGFLPNEWDIEQLMTEIRSFAEIHDEKGLEQALIRTLSRPRTGSRIRKEPDKPVLADLLTDDKIQLVNEVPDWEEAIRLAAQPLLDQQSIQPSYIDSMINSIKREGPYVVLTPKVAIPHARPEEGVDALGMSLLVLKDSVLFPEEKPVNLIIVLAAIDSETHLKALAQLTELLSSPENIEQLIAATNKQEVLETIQLYA
jgi:transcriptional antiterminator/mannitol/fructose-specific phosphotransferase system IIA component